MATDDDDIPETGAIFTYGKSRFADNLPSKFWIRNDKAVGIACGDEHSAIVTESGRLYTFGANDWGQLGLGHMKPTNKPGCVKSLKQEGVKLVACGRSHTIVSTKAGRLYAFGAGSDGQLGTGEGQGGNSPQLIESLPEQEYKVLSAGTDHSAALTTEGKLYVWGSGGEGQLGLGNAESVETPTELKMDSPVRWVSCGYYHTAIVTEDGKLYTFGEKEFGKLGLKEDQLDETSTPTHVSSIKEPVKMVACGGGHTAVITEKGNLYTFGDGNHGQLGHGPSQLQLNTPEKVVRLSEHKCKFVSCGDNHTAVITEKGAMYSFGDGRHGKLGLSEEDFCNIFKPCKVSRFSHFEVQKVSCGGCHMLVMSIKRDQANGELSSEADSEEEDPLTKLNRLSISANDTRIETAAATIAASSLDDSGTPASEKEKLAHTFDGTARGRRRQKEVELPPPLARTLPPLSTSGSSSPRPAPRPLPRQTVALAGANRLDPGKLPEIKNDMTMKHQVKANDASEDDSDDDSDSEPKQTIHPLDKTHYSMSGHREDIEPLVSTMKRRQRRERKKEEEIKAQKISTQKTEGPRKELFESWDSDESYEDGGGSPVKSKEEEEEVKQLQEELRLKHEWTKAELDESLGEESHDTLSPQKEKTPESSEDSSSSDDEAQAQPAPLSAQKLEAVESKEDSNKKSKSSKESKVESLSLKSTGETKLDKEGKKEEVEETQITSISESSAAATPTITMVTPANNAGDAASTSDKSSEKAAQKKEEEKEDDEDEDEDEDESSDTDLEELDPKERKKREKERAKKEKEKQKQLEKERKEKEKAEKERLKQEKEEEKKRKKEEEARKKEEEKKRKEEEKKRKEEEKKAKSKKKVESEDEDEDDEDDEDDDEDDEDEESEESEEEKPLTKKEKERRAKEEAKKAKAREEAKKKEAAKKKKKVVESEEEDSEEESEEEEIKPKGKAKVDIFGKSQTKKSSKLVEDDDDDDEDDDESEDEEEMKNKQKDKEKAKAAETSAKWKFWQKNKEAEEKKKQEEQAKQQAQQEQKSKTCSIL